MARKRRRSNIALPWERRGSWRQLLSGSRWRTGLAIALFALVAISMYEFSDRHHRERTTGVAITDVRRALERFRAHVGRCPRSTTELVHPPRSHTRYIREMPKDGWGRELRVECPSTRDPDEVSVVSAGPSGSFLVDDNVQ